MAAPRSVGEKKKGRRCPKHQSQDFSAGRGEDHGETNCPPVMHEAHRQCRDPLAAHGKSAHARAG